MNFKDFKSHIEDYCNENLPTNLESKPSSKIIHDTTWGTNLYRPHEVSIINTQLFQRLRHVSQMGFANYVYPSARHSRFEHSLGVAILVEKMCKHINSDKVIITENDLFSLRLAGLLHDIGHCLFSHTSELVYGHILDSYITEALGDDAPKVAPHEFLSYLIVTSQSFKKYFDYLKIRDSLSSEIDIEEIALMIVGMVKDENRRYLTSFINGPFDADKIDYFQRDSHFSGLPAQIDLDRLFYEIQISNINTEDVVVRDLTIGITGVMSIEQIMFNKMYLYSSIYNHHKIESLDCMFKGIFEYISESKTNVTIFGRVFDFENPISFLKFSEFDFYALANFENDIILRRMVQNILNRKLLKRAVVINKSTVSVTNGEFLELFLSTGVNRQQKNIRLREIAKQIHQNAGVSCSPHEIWIDLPKAPNLEEGSSTYVRINKNSDTEIVPIDKFFPIAQFQDLYNNNKRSFYVFCPEECLKEIAAATQDYFQKEHNLIFESKAFPYGLPLTHC